MATGLAAKLQRTISLSCSLRERGEREREIVRWQAIHHHPSCKNCQYHSFVVVSFACIKEWVKIGGSGSENFQNNIFARGSFLSQTVDAGWCTGKPSDRSQIGRKQTERRTNGQFFTKRKKINERSLTVGTFQFLFDE